MDEMSSIDEWTRAVQQVDFDRVRALYESDPSLLWKPLSGWDPERDAAHVIVQLKMVQSLGTTLDNLCALQYILLQYCEPTSNEKLTDAQQQTARLLSFLIEVLRGWNMIRPLQKKRDRGKLTHSKLSR